MSEETVDTQKKEELVKKVEELTGNSKGVNNLTTEQLTTYVDALYEFKTRTAGMSDEDKTEYENITKGLNPDVGVPQFFSTADKLFKSWKAEQEVETKPDEEDESDSRVKDSPKGKVSEKVTTTGVDNLVEDQLEAPLGDDTAYFEALANLSKRQRKMSPRASG